MTQVSDFLSDPQKDPEFPEITYLYVMNKYYRHFKGGVYRFIGIAKDSETLEEMVVYQAMYGDHQMWVRPKEMFFGKVERDGRVLDRFTELSDQEALPWEPGTDPETWKNEPPF